MPEQSRPGCTGNESRLASRAGNMALMAAQQKAGYTCGGATTEVLQAAWTGAPGPIVAVVPGWHGDQPATGGSTIHNENNAQR